MNLNKYSVSTKNTIMNTIKWLSKTAKWIFDFILKPIIFALGVIIALLLVGDMFTKGELLNAIFGF